jgi:hypothetical protein
MVTVFRELVTLIVAVVRVDVVVNVRSAFRPMKRAPARRLLRSSREETIVTESRADLAESLRESKVSAADGSTLDKYKDIKLIGIMSFK